MKKINMTCKIHSLKQRETRCIFSSSDANRQFSFSKVPRLPSWIHTFISMDKSSPAL